MKKIFESGELDENSVCAFFAQTADDGKTYRYKLYALPAIIAVGYRVNSQRTAQFRQWATKVLGTFTKHGFRPVRIHLNSLLRGYAISPTLGGEKLSCAAEANHSHPSKLYKTVRIFFVQSTIKSTIYVAKPGSHNRSRLFPFVGGIFMGIKFFAELSRRLREEQIESNVVGEDRLEVSLGGKPVLFVSPSSDVFLLPAGSGSEEAGELYHRIAPTVDEVYAYVEAVENAPILRAADLHEPFHLLADFGGAVLAGRELERGQGYQFVTWVWDFDRLGVSHGHYYEGDFQSAKEDFAVRSELISNVKIFTPEQLTELYRATDHYLETGSEPDDTQLKALQDARTKIECTVPDLPERLEPTQECGQKFVQ